MKSTALIASAVAALWLAGCGKKEEPPAAPPAPAPSPAPAAPAPTPVPPLPEPQPPKDAPPAPAPGQANDHSNPAFQGGGKPDPAK